MASDYGIKILKPGAASSISDPVTEQNKKDFIILNTVDTHKLLKAFDNGESQNNYTHGLGYTPFALVFERHEDHYRATRATVTPTLVDWNPQDVYVMVFNTRMV